ncbi:hypothetical protein Tco_0819896 [Tanacetum coccineum]|uniref:Uncharacterized protein n=1 Tax=Tanacetum coccineum TaxID=301880 RepID=A0ABQ5AAH9_9ASTR
MPSRRDNRVRTRGRDSSQQAKDVTEVGSNQPNNAQDVITQNVEAANAIEQMEELTSQFSEHELDEPGPQDTYFKVMGNDKNEIAEMYGLVSIDERLSIELAEYKAREAQKKVRVIMILMVQMFHIHHHRASLLPMNLVLLRVGLQVYLQSISKCEIVAKGSIRSLDPDEYRLFVTVQAAIGAPVAWPCYLVSWVSHVTQNTLLSQNLTLGLCSIEPRYVESHVLKSVTTLLNIGGLFLPVTLMPATQWPIGQFSELRHQFVPSQVTAKLLLLTLRSLNESIN